MLHLERSCASSAHWTEEQYQEMFSQAKADMQRLVLLGGELPGEMLGFLVARHLAPEWELENIVVAPTARRIGLGMRLIQALLVKARETNSEAVFLEVRESNTAARALYEKTGFALTGRRKAYYTNPPEDAVLYRLRLP
jgi:ribosomal-protein-alanine N-acetyltransferase